MNTIIRYADICEVGELFKLIQSSFDKYIEFTPYISPQSINILEKEILNFKNMNNYEKIWKVVSLKNKIIGFYCLKILPDYIFLNYIGIDIEYRSLGFGNAMLADIEKEAKSVGKNIIELDVFRSNETAYRWYKNKGFNESSIKSMNLIKIFDQDVSIYNCVKLDDLTLANAISEENRIGYSFLSGTIGNKSITYALIGNKYVKIVKPEVVSDLGIIRDSISFFNNSREYILFGSDPNLKIPFSIKRKEILIRMKKNN